MVIVVLQHCHCSFVITTKRIGSMRYIYFIEGVVFTVIAGVFAIFLFLRFGVSPDLREELLRRAPRRLTRILNGVWGNRSSNRL